LNLKHLSLLNFKNYENLEIDFSEGVNCITGSNGVGKTNLLDAVYYLALTKSYFNPIDKQMVRHEEKMMMVKGEFANADKKEIIVCSLRSGQKKMVKRNRKEYAKISEHIGLIPIVMITPFDSFLVLEGSDVRRKFVDGIISQEDQGFLQILIQYNRALAQRNQLLKHFSREHHFDEDALDIWDAKLIDLGETIFDKRNAFIENFIPVFLDFYKRIGGEDEKVNIEYRSSLSEGNYKQQLKNAVREDLLKQYTTKGIHKDDLVFTIDGYPLKKFGSQGQQKTFLLALKLAQFRQMQLKMGKAPILLLDDIYDKLDSARMKHLMELVSEKGFEQIFITDTHPTRVKEMFTQSGFDVNSVQIKEGGLIDG
jgi:DNA replication and repair protein RecF